MGADYAIFGHCETRQSAREQNECERAGGNAMCATFFGIFSFATVVLSVLLVLLCYILSKHKRFQEAKRVSEGFSRTSINMGAVDYLKPGASGDNDTDENSHSCSSEDFFDENDEVVGLGKICQSEKS